MTQPWLKQYPAGVPETIDSHQFASLADMYEEAFKKYSPRRLATNMDKHLTYQEVDALSTQVGAWLQQQGLSQGDRVAIMMPNCLQYPVLVAAILRAGYCAVNVNPLYTVKELTHQLKDSETKLIFILENFASTLEKSLPDLPLLQKVVVSTLGDMLGLKGHLVNFVLRRVKKMIPAWHIKGAVSFKYVLSESSTLTLKKPTLTHDDLAFLQYTGGTTGVSKGAVLTHGNILSNVLQVESWCKPAVGNQEGLVFVAALPLYHIFGLTACALFATRIGSHLLLITNPRDIPAFIKDMSKYPPGVLPAVNTLFNALLNHPDFSKLDFSKLRFALGGGMAVQRAVAERFQKLTGVVLSEAYGLSETSPGAVFNPMMLDHFSGYIGVPLPSTEVKIIDDDGQSLPFGEAGEIAIKGPQVMRGYWKRDEETTKVMTSDGFFRSGDIGIMNEDGYIKIVDRKKDMILVSGFNVYPNEIEDAAVMNPKVLEAAAIGIPDEHSGEAVKLFVVKKDPSLTETELLEFLKLNLTGYKRPRFIEFRDDLPKSNVGKILRKDLRG